MSNALTISSYSFDPQYENKIVHTSGMLSWATGARDDLFQISSDSAALNRSVEVYQWIEDLGRDSEDNVEARYSQQWAVHNVDSSDFLDRTKVNIRSSDIYTEIFLANDITLGEISISDNIAKDIETKDSFLISASDATTRFSVQENGRYMYSGNDYLQPAIGDIRASFSIHSESVYTVLGEYVQGSIQKISDSDTPHMLRSLIMGGERTFGEVRKNLSQKIKASRFGFRLFGFVLIFGGCMIALSMRSWNNSNKDGGLLGALSLLAVGSAAASIALVTIGVSWMIARVSIYGLPIFIVGLVLYGMYRYTNKEQ